MTILLAAASYNLTWSLGIWLFIALFAFIFSVLNVNDAIRDRKYLKRSGLNGFREIIARDALISEISRCFAQFLFLLVGLQAFFAPWILGHLGQHVFVLTFDTELILATLLIGFNTLLVRFTRNGLIEYNGDNRKEK
jgi:hypothetical protein